MGFLMPVKWLFRILSLIFIVTNVAIATKEPTFILRFWSWVLQTNYALAIVIVFGILTLISWLK